MDIYIPKRNKRGNPVLWLNPVTGDYRVPMDPDAPIPDKYKALGLERREFTSYHEHQSVCKKLGLVNHYDEDIRNDDDLLGRGESKDSIGNKY